MRAVVLLLALSLIGAPIVSSFAFSAKPSQPETSGNNTVPSGLGAAVLHSHPSTPVSLEVAYHTAHPSPLPASQPHEHQNHSQQNCHEQDCRGACCTMCMHCFSVLSAASNLFPSTRGAIAHDVPALSPVFTMQRLERPPQAILLTI